MEEFFERRADRATAVEEWTRNYQHELARRSNLSIVDAAEVWALDEIGASLCLEAHACGDEEYSANLLAGATISIVSIANRALTRTGRKIKIDQAVYAIRSIQRKNSEHEVLVAWCDLLAPAIARAAKD
jgi:hypothetical protein